MPAYILRFQEPCVESGTQTLGSGTQTETRVRQESGDSDRQSFRITPAARKQEIESDQQSDVLLAAQTATLTEVSREAPDKDQPKSFATFSATETFTGTAVKAEQADSDQRRYRSLAGTEGTTHTYVDKEAPKTDPHRPRFANAATKTAVDKEGPDNLDMSYLAIPKCF